MIIKVRIKTSQKTFSIEKGETWKISVRSVPEKGEANREIIKELGKLYQNVSILKGLRTKNKVIFLGSEKV